MALTKSQYKYSIVIETKIQVSNEIHSKTDSVTVQLQFHNSIMQIHELLEELAMVEEEIILLERKIKELKHRLCQERDHTMDWEIHNRRQSKIYKKFQGSLITEKRFNSHNSQGRKSRDRRASLSSVLDIHSLFSTPRNSNGIYTYDIC